ncbi:MAG: S4 domain-containing protein, partial [Candidatus Binatia bacterium]
MSDRPALVRVPALGAGVRLDVFLAARGLAGTRSQAKAMVDAGRVLVDRRPRKAGFVLRGGETLEIAASPERPSDAAAEDLPLSILYEDEDLLALDKPPGMV